MLVPLLTNPEKSELRELCLVDMIQFLSECRVQLLHHQGLEAMVLAVPQAQGDPDMTTGVRLQHQRITTHW
jgi:hypothetical protein